MRIIVGLGNPGPEYEWTPHNIGFLAVNALADRAGIRVTRPEAKCLVGHGTFAGEEVVLAKPQTMMNLSGVAVRMLLERYECEPESLIVLIDEVDLPWGMIRVRERGRRSTHNGMKSILAALGTEEFIRIRLGVQPKQIWGDRRDYVLCSMGREERRMADEMIGEAIAAIEAIFAEGVNKAMSKFNRRAPDADAEEDSQ